MRRAPPLCPRRTGSEMSTLHQAQAPHARNSISPPEAVSSPLTGPRTRFRPEPSHQFRQKKAISKPFSSSMFARDPSHRRVRWVPRRISGMGKLVCPCHSAGTACKSIYRYRVAGLSVAQHGGARVPRPGAAQWAVRCAKTNNAIDFTRSGGRVLPGRCASPPDG